MRLGIVGWDPISWTLDVGLTPWIPGWGLDKQGAVNLGEFLEWIGPGQHTLPSKMWNTKAKTLPLWYNHCERSASGESNKSITDISTFITLNVLILIDVIMSTWGFPLHWTWCRPYIGATFCQTNRRHGGKKQLSPKVSSFKRLIFRLVLSEMGVRQFENASC